jgi:tyrosyl-tRNA synthetase
MKFPAINEQMDALKRGIDTLISEDELVKKLQRAEKTNTPLKIKLGADPSRPDLHIGHAVPLRKLAQFQEFGHEIQLIIGDFTASIGDPTGKNKTRPPITLEQAREYGSSYMEQAKLILSDKNLNVVYNSDWLGKMTFHDVIKLSANYTVAQILERDDFSKRYKSGSPISLHEFLYPLAQGQDSVYLRSDVELGGTDQLFNLLVGRELQRANGLEPQVVMTFPLLEGTDGVEKMSKSLHNYIGLTDAPDQMYGKILSIPDELIIKYFTLATNMNLDEIQSLDDAMKKGENPRNVKRRLARDIIAIYYNVDKAQEAEKAFDNLFIKKDIPDDMPETHIKCADEMKLISVLVENQILSSNGEVRRMFKQNAISINGEKESDEMYKFNECGEFVVKVGKRKFLRILCV